jgi:hypothetical protein
MEVETISDSFNDEIITTNFILQFTITRKQI